MRKILAFGLVLFILFSLCCCRKTNGNLSYNSSEMISTSDLELTDTSVTSDSSETQTSSAVKQNSQSAVEIQDLESIGSKVYYK